MNLAFRMPNKHQLRAVEETGAPWTDIMVVNGVVYTTFFRAECAPQYGANSKFTVAQIWRVTINSEKPLDAYKEVLYYTMTDTREGRCEHNMTDLDNFSVDAFKLWHKAFSALMPFKEYISHL